MGAFEARFATRSPPAGGVAVGAIDIGASKVACLIGVAAPGDDADRPIDIAGAGSVPLRAGADPETCIHLSRVALDQALRMAGDLAPPFGAAYGGPDLASVFAVGDARLRGPVGPRDVAAAIAAARASLPLSGRRVLHASPVAYCVDDGDTLVDPRGAEGRVLTAEICLVHAPAEAVSDTEAALEAAGARPAFTVAGPFAAGQAVLTAEEREAGAAIIDLGEGGAGLAVFRAGALQHAETVPGGGARLTRDLAARLNTSLAVAERAKLLHGGLNGDGDPDDAIETPVLGPDGRLTPGIALRGAFAEALTPRLEEIFARIAARLDAVDAAEGAGVALTGGVSATPGLRLLAARILRRPVRIAAMGGLGGFEGGGGWAVAAGLVRCGLERAVAGRSAPATAGSRRVGDALTWIKENF